MINNNLYAKIQAAKKQLADKNLKKTGKNSFSNFEYYELSDFMPSIIAIFDELKLFSKVTFTEETATLKIVNSENPSEQEEYTSPMRPLELKGTNAMQALGGAETYQRRYLYMAALDITEGDMLDSASKFSSENLLLSGAEKTPEKTTDDLSQSAPLENEKANISGSGNNTPTEKQLKRLYALRKTAEIANPHFERILKKYCNSKTKDTELTIDEYNFLCEKIQGVIENNAKKMTDGSLKVGKGDVDEQQFDDRLPWDVDAEGYDISA